MANAIKYSTSPQTLALKKGDYWIGTGDVGKGPTSSTDYWHGITPPVSGYTVYVNKASQGPSIRVANTDAQLITITNQIASQSYTSVTQCFNYFQTQSDKMVVQRDYESIITDGLVINVDAGFLPSYPQSGTTWYDLSSNDNNGTLTNGPTYDSADGGSIDLDGTDDYVDFGDKNSFTLASGFSLEVWFKVSGYSATTYNGSLISKNPDTSVNTREYVFGFSGGNVYCWAHSQQDANNYRGRYVSSTSSYISDNTWVNIIGTYDGGTGNDSFKIYINATQRDNTNFSAGSFLAMTNSANPLTIGLPNIGVGGSTYLNGNIGVARVYNRALSSSEILQNYYSLRIGRYFDPDAQTFITNAGITNSTEKNAINKLVVDLKIYNLWSKMKFIYPFVGGTSTTCKYNLVNPADTDGAYRLIFNGGLTFSSSGMTGAVNGYADTKLAPASAFSDFIQSYGVYLLENFNTYYNELGVRPAAGVNSQIVILPRHTGTFFGDLTFQRRITTSSSDSRGFFCISRTSTTDFRLYRNGSQVGATNTSTLTTLISTETSNIWLSGMNLNGSVDGASPRTKAFAYASTGLNSTEIANLYTAVQAFQTSLSRQV